MGISRKIKDLKINATKAKVLIFMVLILGFTLRLYEIKKNNLWFDELLSNIYTYQFTTSRAQWHGISKISYFSNVIGGETHSILYNLLVYIYSFFFGGWESVRYLSLFFSMLSLIIFYRLSRLFLNQKESICALIIMAFNPFQIWYAQEARAFALSGFLAISMIYLYIKALRTNKLSYWIYFSIAGIANVYSNYHSFFLIIVSGLILLLKENRKFIKKWLLSFFAIIASFLPLLPVFMKQFYSVKNDFWIRPPTLSSLPLTFGVLSLGYSATLNQLNIGIVLFIALFIYGVYAHYRCYKNYTITILSFFLLPILLIYIWSKIIMPIYLDRKFIIFSPFYYLLLSKGIISIRNRIFKASIVICVAFLILFSLFNYYQRGLIISRPDGKDFYPGVHFKKNYSDLIAYIIKELDNKKDVICTTDVQSLIITSHYLHRYKPELMPEIVYYLFYPHMLPPEEKIYLRLKNIKADVSDVEKNTLVPYCRYFKDGRQIIDKATVVDSVDRLWLISSIWNESGPLLPNSSEIRKYILSKYKKLLSRDKDGIFVELYIKGR